jgi:hypothetical protein
MDKIFNQLREWSEREDSFSIRDFAKEIDVPYIKILELSKENEDWEHEFNMARDRLALRAEELSMARKITSDECARYTYENDLLLRAHIQESEEIEIPDEPDEFDVWVEERIAKDNAELEALSKPRIKRGER